MKILYLILNLLKFEWLFGPSVKIDKRMLVRDFYGSQGYVTDITNDGFIHVDCNPESIYNSQVYWLPVVQKHLGKWYTIYNRTPIIGDLVYHPQNKLYINMNTSIDIAEIVKSNEKNINYVILVPAKQETKPPIMALS